VYLLYVDESGQTSATKGSSAYFVLAGLAVHEEDCYPFAQSLATVQFKAVGRDHAGLELHASRIWGGRHEWSKVSGADRMALLDAVFQHLASWQAPSGRAPTYFAVAIHKKSFRGRSIIELAHEELFARFDALIGRLHRAGDSHRSLVIADASSYEALVQRLAPTWKRGGRIGKLHSLIEVPLFVSSHASPLVQVADFIAWAIWNYYEHRHTQYAQYLNDRFDAAGGIQHGVAHMIRGYNHCGCIPCESRRTHSVTATMPSKF
jgi:hypothetical protein